VDGHEVSVRDDAMDLNVDGTGRGEEVLDRLEPVPGLGVGVAAIESADGPIYLWAAPTEDGRQCWLIQAGGDPATGRPYGFGSCGGTDTSGAI